MLIEVTEEDIARGLSNDACLCPIALALKRATRNTWQVGYSEAVCAVYPFMKFDLPPEASDFVDRFDNGIIDSDDTFRPFKFEVRIPDVDERTS